MLLFPPYLQFAMASCQHKNKLHPPKIQRFNLFPFWTERLKGTDEYGSLLATFHSFHSKWETPCGSTRCERGVPAFTAQSKLRSHFTILTNTKWRNTFYKEKYILQFRGEQIWRRCALLHRPIKTELCRGRRRIRSIVQCF